MLRVSKFGHLHAFENRKDCKKPTAQVSRRHQVGQKVNPRLPVVFHRAASIRTFLLRQTLEILPYFAMLTRWQVK